MKGIRPDCPAFEDALAFYFDQPDHAIPNRDFVVEVLLDIVPGIVLPRIGTQVDHIGINRQAVLPNSMSNIARHAAWHGWIGAVRGLKLVVDQYLLVIDTHANQAIGLACFNSVLFCVNDCKNFNVLAPEGESGKVVWGISESNVWKSYQILPCEMPQV